MRDGARERLESAAVAATAAKGLSASCNYLYLTPGLPPYVILPQVSWIRKRDLHILTSMSVTYTSDERFTIVGNPATDDWNLRIDYVQPRDAGVYECQVNTEPKIHRAVALKVLGEFPRGMRGDPSAHKSLLKILPPKRLT